MVCGPQKAHMDNYLGIIVYPNVAYVACLIQAQKKFNCTKIHLNHQLVKHYPGQVASLTTHY